MPFHNIIIQYFTEISYYHNYCKCEVHVLCIYNLFIISDYFSLDFSLDGARELSYIAYVIVMLGQNVL